MHCPASGIRGTVYPVVYGKCMLRHRWLDTLIDPVDPGALLLGPQDNLEHNLLYLTQAVNSLLRN